MVWVWPTMPKRGAATMAMRRSRSSLRPVISAWTGALKPTPAAFCRDIVHASVGDQKRTCDPVRRHVGKGRCHCREQLRTVGFPIGLSGLDDAYLQSLDLLEPIDQRIAGFIGFARALTEILARAAVHHHSRDRKSAARAPPA